MDLYLPLPEDQSVFRENLALFEDELNVFLFMLKVAESADKVKQNSRVDNFTCAYAYESLDNSILAAQSYLFLSQQYFENPFLSLTCLKKAESLLMEASDQFAIANFLEKLDRDWLEQLLKKLPNNEYLEKILLKKDAIRIAFEEYLRCLEKLSPKPDKPTCFICFNVEEEDVGKWLEDTLVSES